MVTLIQLRRQRVRLALLEHRHPPAHPKADPPAGRSDKDVQRGAATQLEPNLSREWGLLPALWGTPSPSEARRSCDLQHRLKLPTGAQGKR